MIDFYRLRNIDRKHKFVRQKHREAEAIAVFDE